MATVKITITLPENQVKEIRERVAKDSGGVSGFIRHAVQQSLDNSAEFLAMIEQGLMETGGPSTAKERAWARRMLSPRKRGAKPAKPRKAA